METLPRMIETQSYNSRKRKTPQKIIRLNVCTQTPCVSGSYQILKLFSGTIFWSLSSVTSETWATFLPQFGLWEQNITRKCQRVWFPHFKFKRGGEWIGSLPRMAFQKIPKNIPNAPKGEQFTCEYVTQWWEWWENHSEQRPSYTAHLRNQSQARR